MSETSEPKVIVSPSERSERRKTQYHILPWEGIRLAAELMTQSNNPDKHQDAKWKRMTPEEHIDALMRHLNAWLTKNAVDSESGMSHLVHVAVRALMAAERETDEILDTWMNDTEITNLKEDIQRLEEEIDD
jgi:hypothetical protein